MNNWPIYERADWNPLMGLRGLQQEMNRLFDGYSGGRQTGQFPLMNLWSNGEEVVVTAEVPGIDPNNVDISVVKNLLTVEGERKADDLGEGVVCHRDETGTGRFSRTVQLPFEIQNDQVSAKYRKGVLTITLPRSEVSKPRKIQIASA